MMSNGEAERRKEIKRLIAQKQDLLRKLGSESKGAPLGHEIPRASGHYPDVLEPIQKIQEIDQRISKLKRQ